MSYSVSTLATPETPNSEWCEYDTLSHTWAYNCGELVPHLEYGCIYFHRVNNTGLIKTTETQHYRGYCNVDMYPGTDVIPVQNLRFERIVSQLLLKN
ncbi:hypothetical protein Lepto7375DRAFT_7268 [Leptolyngbya sp. PCC 7375]|nr:hypothetical protein Lepto7375DRAFT_7268 [Leptolyngbya sp. PCC 7375]